MRDLSTRQESLRGIGHRDGPGVHPNSVTIYFNALLLLCNSFVKRCVECSVGHELLCANLVALSMRHGLCPSLVGLWGFSGSKNNQLNFIAIQAFSLSACCHGAGAVGGHVLTGGTAIKARHSRNTARSSRMASIPPSAATSGRNPAWNCYTT